MIQIDKKNRSKEYYGIPLTLASLLLFSDRRAFQMLLRRGSFFDSESIKKKIYKSSAQWEQLFIERKFFLDFWKKLSHQEVILSSCSFRRILKVDKKTFAIIVDKNQRIKDIKGAYYKISYVNKLLEENNQTLA